MRIPIWGSLIRKALNLYKNVNLVFPFVNVLYKYFAASTSKQVESPVARTGQSQTAGYRIEAVAKRTAISRDKLCVWERRYASVVPERTADGGRLYTTDDISRLRLIKQLVNGGDSIGAVASRHPERQRPRPSEL
jgi:hypothetical protein